MDSKLKLSPELKTGIAGIVLGAAGELTNLVSRSPIGTAAHDSLNAGYNLEHFVNGAGQVGAFAGVTLAAYGFTKVAIKNGFPIASEKTSTVASLTSAVIIAYRLFHTEIFTNSLCNMSSYDHQIQNALEVIATVGIATGLIATGTLVVKDICCYIASKI